jgi:hypothetical protein
MKRVFIPYIFLLHLLPFIARSQAFSSSNLPIVMINSGGQLVDSAWYDIVVNMGVIDNGLSSRNNVTDAFNNYNGKIKIRAQGSSSVMWPKRSFRVTLINAFNQHTDAALMGLPAHEDWIFKALYQDKSFLRDDLAFKIYNEMGHYSSRSRFFELVIDGEYRGVYQLLEKIKRDPQRVNISKLSTTDLSGDNLTGGYIISLDKFVPGDAGWYSKYKSNISQDSANYFLFYYPKYDSMVDAQRNYIKSYFDMFEDALAGTQFSNPSTGYRKYIDVLSFVDNFIINELSRNVDGYRASTFFYKNKESSGNGKLQAGPIWDYNIGFGNCSYNGGNDPYWWQYEQYPTINFVPWWWRKFMTDSAFKNDLKCRYNFLRENVLKESNLTAYIDAMAALLQESQQRNFQKWPIMGQAVYPNPSPVPASYAEEIAYLKWWLHERLAWLDQNLPGPCIVAVKENKIPFDQVTSFPNPFTSEVTLTYSVNTTTKVKIELFDMLGARLMEAEESRKEGAHQQQLNTTRLSAGTYVLRLSINDMVYHSKLVKTRD